MIGPETSIIVYDGQEKQEDNMISIPLDDKKTGGGNRLSIQVPNDSRLVEGDYYAEIIWEIQNVL